MKQQQPPPPSSEPPINVTNHPNRHRDETMKDLHSFAQDFKLTAMQNEQPMPSSPQLQGPPQAVEQVFFIYFPNL